MRFFKTVNTLATILTLSVLGIQTANAQSAQLKNVSTNRCVNAPRTTPSREYDVTISTCRATAGESQTVQFVKLAKDRWSIRSANGGACLNLKTSVENREGGRVKWAGCSSHRDQQWNLTAAQTSVGMQNKIQHTGSGKCLNVHRGRDNRNGGNVTVYSCADTPDQRWTWTTTASATGLNDLKIASHNVWFMTVFGTNVGDEDHYQDVRNIEARSRAIVADGYLKGQDVLVLNELFDNGASNYLLRGLRPDYPHQTAVAARSSEGGRDNWDATHGDYRPRARLEAGVAILSKWPIERKEQYLFRKADLCGYDERANKGFAYARINYRNTQKIHVIATHLQSEVPLECRDANDAGFTAGHRMRTRQLRAIKNFVDSKNIPSSEPVFVAGDLNIIYGNRESSLMLRELNANRPVFTGNRGSYDGTDNPLVGNNLYPQILDYVLTLKDHVSPSPWYTEIRKKNGMADHYPVFASSKRTGSTVKPDLSEYQITIATARGRGAGTDSNIVAIINGRSGKSRRVKLNDRIYRNAFEIGSAETVKVEAEKLVEPKSITLEFDDKHPGSDWRIRGIKVQKVGSNETLSWTGDYEFTSRQNRTFPLR